MSLTVPWPPGRAFLLTIAPAVVVGILTAAIVGWPLAVAVALLASVGRQLDVRLRRLDITFAQGFLPFRDRLDWPRGVQEEDTVSWRWPARPGARPATGR